MMNEIETIEKSLSGDRLTYIPALTAIKRGAAEAVYIGEETAILSCPDYGLYYVCCPYPELLPPIEKWRNNSDYSIVVLNQPCIEPLEALTRPLRNILCYQAVYDSIRPIKYEDRDLRIVPLTPDYTDFIYDNYSLKPDKDYIRERLASGEVAGAYLPGGELAGFAGRHSEGSMGFLEVLPDFRHLGVATALQAYVINMVLLKGETPFAHIREKNIASLKLQAKFKDMKLALGMISWLVFE